MNKTFAIAALAGAAQATYTPIMGQQNTEMLADPNLVQDLLADLQSTGQLQNLLKAQAEKKRTQQLMQQEQLMNLGFLRKSLEVTTNIVEIGLEVDAAEAAVADATATTADALADANTSYNEAVADATATTTDALADAKTSTTDALVDATTSTTDALADAKTSTTEAVTDAKTTTTDALADAKTNTTDAVADATATTVDALADATATTADALADAKTTTTDALADATATTADALADAKTTTTDAVADAISTTTDALADAETTTVDAVADAKTTTTDALADATATTADALADATATTANALADAKATTIEAVNGSISSTQTALDNAIVSTETAINDATAVTEASIEDAIATTEEAIDVAVSTTDVAISTTEEAVNSSISIAYQSAKDAIFSVWEAMFGPGAVISDKITEETSVALENGSVVTYTPAGAQVQPVPVPVSAPVAVPEPFNPIVDVTVTFPNIESCHILGDQTLILQCERQKLQATLEYEKSIMQSIAAHEAQIANGISNFDQCTGLDTFAQAECEILQTAIIEINNPLITDPCKALTYTQFQLCVAREQNKVQPEEPVFVDPVVVVEPVVVEPVVVDPVVVVDPIIEEPVVVDGTIDCSTYVWEVDQAQCYQVNEAIATVNNPIITDNCVAFGNSLSLFTTCVQVSTGSVDPILMPEEETTPNFDSAIVDNTPVTPILPYCHQYWGEEYNNCLANSDWISLINDPEVTDDCISVVNTYNEFEDCVVDSYLVVDDTPEEPVYCTGDCLKIAELRTFYSYLGDVVVPCDIHNDYVQYYTCVTGQVEKYQEEQQDLTNLWRGGNGYNRVSRN